MHNGNQAAIAKNKKFGTRLDEPLWDFLRLAWLKTTCFVYFNQRLGAAHSKCRVKKFYHKKYGIPSINNTLLTIWQLHLFLHWNKTWNVPMRQAPLRWYKPRRRMPNKKMMYLKRSSVKQPYLTLVHKILRNVRSLGSNSRNLPQKYLDL